MMDLSQISGLPMCLDDTGKLHLHAQVVVEDYRVRVLDELTPVYLDQQACQGKTIAYEMINGIFEEKDRQRLAGLPVRYELTLFPPMKVGREYIKTLGHIHLPDANSGIDYPEVCEVLVGRAHFLFMKLDPDHHSASEVFFVEVKAGQKLIIPPGYDHLTINPGPGPMLFSDVVARAVGGNYERMKAVHGAAYLEVEENDQAVFIPNPFYRAVPVLTQKYVKDFPVLGLTRDRPLYSAFLETQARDWEFLWRPEMYPLQFPTLDAILTA
jgi:glucose-6-phosphate isomerase